MGSESSATQLSTGATDHQSIAAAANSVSVASNVASDDDDDFKLSKPKGA